MSPDLARALIADLDDEALSALAERLRPFLAEDHTPAAGLTVDQAAARAGVSARSVRRALAARTLRGSQRAGRWRIDAGDLQAWIAAGAQTTVAAPTAATGRGRAASSRRGADAIAGRGPG